MIKISKLPEGFDPAERASRAENLFKQGYNCSQAVVLAFADIIEAEGGPDAEMLSQMMSGFGGGFGRMREVCGTVSGMTMMADFIAPSPRPASHTEQAGADGDSPQAAKKANYALVQEFAGEFRKINGSIICRELLGLSPISRQDSPVPSERTEEYYRKRPCGELCSIAAGIVARKLAETLINR